MQKSKLKGLTIRPADASSRNAMNAASVDELRDAIGHISLARSSTFDKVKLKITKDLSKSYH